MAKARKSKFLTAVLAFFGGSFGLHRFYLGDHQAGFVFIFLTVFLSAFTIPVTAIMGVFEALRFFSMGQSEFDRKYNKHMTNTYSQDYRKQRSGKTQKTRAKQPTNYKKRENPYKKTGFKKYEESDIEGAIDDLEEALKINPNDKSIYFRLACGYSLMEEPQESLNYLNEAIRQGYKDFDKINSIDDLAFLRISPMFQAYKAQGYSANPNAQLSAPKKGLLQDDLLLSQLKKLAELRERGLLSETDYQIEKQKLRTRRG